MKRKVAIYARVSTEHEAQLSALENQVQYYDGILKQHHDWILYDRYIDEGVTGTSTNKRKNFMRMIEDAREGRFDLIVTREVSRFERNTVDALQETRKLKKIGVEVYFTEDNIWTFNDEDGELKLTIMATLAQNESKKTSQRVKAGQMISFQNGVIYGTGNILGYDKVGKDLIVNEEQAEIVRFIYSEYLNGKGTVSIADELTRREAKTSTGLTNWSAAYISRVLRNPFYSGTIVYRKSYIPDYLEQKPKMNYGEVEQVIVEGRHQISIVCVLDKGLIFNVYKDNLTNFTIIPTNDTVLARSDSDIESSLYFFYLLMLQYLDNVYIQVPSLIEYAKKNNSFKVGLSIPNELIPNDAIYKEGNVKMEYGDIRKLLDLNKKYPNLYNGKMTYEELHQYLKDDFILMTDIQAKFANTKEHKSIKIYGYEFTPKTFEQFRGYANEYDSNEESKKSFDNIVDQIYKLYLDETNKSSNKE